MNRGYFLAIAGNIGVGKTELTNRLSAELGWVAYYEPVMQNPYLDVFYADMPRWSFHLQGAMTEVDYQNYSSLFHVMVAYLRKPDLVIYLKASPEVLLQRIAQRGRPSEQNIGRDYIVSLSHAYDDWMARVRGEMEVLEI